jgi:tRNA(adenine34) deaminase
MGHEHVMKKALEEARRALKKGEFPVGCVLVYEGETLATGSRRGTGQGGPNEFDHAEMVALRRFVHLGKSIEREKVVVYSTLEPCLMCYAAFVVNGIRQIVYAYEDVFGGGTNMDLKALKPFYSDITVDITAGILREESLALLKAFFSEPNNRYLKGTLLAQHAMQA